MRNKNKSADSDYFRELELSRIESQYELESDEGGTAREKAIAMLSTEKERNILTAIQRIKKNQNKLDK